MAESFAHSREYVDGEFGVHRIDLSDGSQIESTGGNRHPSMVSDTHIYMYDFGDGNLYKLDKTDYTSQSWSNNIGYRLTEGAYDPSSGNIWFGSASPGSTITVIDDSDGSVVTTHDFDIDGDSTTDACDFIHKINGTSNFILGIQDTVVKIDDTGSILTQESFSDTEQIVGLAWVADNRGVVWKDPGSISRVVLFNSSLTEIDTVTITQGIQTGTDRTFTVDYNNELVGLGLNNTAQTVSYSNDTVTIDQDISDIGTIKFNTNGKIFGGRMSDNFHAYKEPNLTDIWTTTSGDTSGRRELAPKWSSFPGSWSTTVTETGTATAQSGLASTLSVTGLREATTTATPIGGSGSTLTVTTETTWPGVATIQSGSGSTLAAVAVRRSTGVATAVSGAGSSLLVDATSTANTTATRESGVGTVLGALGSGTATPNATTASGAGSTLLVQGLVSVPGVATRASGVGTSLLSQGTVAITANSTVAASVGSTLVVGGVPSTVGIATSSSGAATTLTVSRIIPRRAGFNEPNESVMAGSRNTSVLTGSRNDAV